MPRAHAYGVAVGGSSSPCLVGVNVSVRPCVGQAFDGHDHLMATGADDRAIILWNVHTRQQMFKLEGHTKAVLCCAFGPNGLLVSCGCDNVIRMWDISRIYTEAWSARRHSVHGWGLRRCVHAVVLVANRLQQSTRHTAARQSSLPHLPEEMWFAVLKFCCSADFFLAPASNQK